MCPILKEQYHFVNFLPFPFGVTYPKWRDSDARLMGVSKALPVGGVLLMVLWNVTACDEIRVH